MKKIILMTALAFVLTGCGAFDRGIASVTGTASKTCIDGVVYLQFTSGATVQVDQQGKPVACK